MASGPNPNPLIGATGTQWLEHGRGYGNPWDDEASKVMPRTMPDALRWSQAINMLDGTLAEALRRVASYFVTDVEVKPFATANSTGQKLSSDDKQKVLDFLAKRDVRQVLKYAAINYLCYGVNFISLLVPFKRYLRCPKCQNHEAPLETVGSTPAYEFAFTDFEFHAKCPLCDYKGPWGHIDRRGDAESDIVVKFWNVHEMEILDDPLRDEQSFIWKIPEYYRRYIREGKLWHLCRANWEVIQAVKHGHHVQFDDGVVYYMRDKPLAGIYAGGWGFSKALVNFRQSWHCQMLRRLNEAICAEFVVPFRVISPEPKAGGDPASSDPVLGMNLGQFRAQVTRMIRAHRKDPGEVQVSPVSFNYQLLGGEATQLAPFQLIDQATDSLLNASGVPADLYKGTLTMQAAPAALRLFESYWAPLVDQLNGLLTYIVDRAGQVLNWEPVQVAMKKVRTADDLNRQMAVIQLMMAKAVSQETGLAMLDLNFKAEQDNLIAEQTYVQDKTQEAQEEAQAKATQQSAVPGVVQQAAQGQAQPGGQPGAPAPGGAPPPQSQGPQSVEQIQAKADEIAQQLQQMPDSQRKSEMIELKKSDTTLHALVKSKLDSMHQTNETAGAAQLQAQQQQQPPQQPKTAAALPHWNLAMLRDRLRKAG